MCNIASFRTNLAKFASHGVTTVVQSRAFVRVSEAHRVVVQDVRVLQVTVQYNMQPGQDPQMDSAEASDHVGQGRVRSHFVHVELHVFKRRFRLQARQCSASRNGVEPKLTVLDAQPAKMCVNGSANRGLIVVKKRVTDEQSRPP